MIALLLFTLLYSQILKPQENGLIVLKRQGVDELDDIIISTTLDGYLHGIKKSTGRIIWSKQPDWGPMLRVIDRQVLPVQPSTIENDIPIPKSEKIIFIPEPGGSGDLYFMGNGGKPQKLSITLKDIVEKRLGKPDGDYMVTGNKVAKAFALNPFTGDLVASFDENDVNKSENTLKSEIVIYLARTQYTVNIWDKKTAQLLWKIIYSEFSPLNGNSCGVDQQDDAKNIVIANPAKMKWKITSDVFGKLQIYQRSTERLVSSACFKSPVLATYNILVDSESSAKLDCAFDFQARINMEAAFIGNFEGTLYILTAKTFPFLNFIEISDEESKDAGESHEISVRPNRCSPGAFSPECLVGPLQIPYTPEPILTIGESDSSSSQMSQFLIAALTFIALIQPLIFSYFFKKKESISAADNISSKNIETLENSQTGRSVKEETKMDSHDFEPSESSILSSSTPLPNTNPQGLQSFVLSDTVLGYGSHGTVVFKGTFQGRPVAIKRLLADFYNVADHEVKLLQESDHHPNICRYFHREECDGFMYIALELCQATLFDVIVKKDTPEVHSIIKQLSVPEALRQMMVGISHLHSLNIVHRDIKPQNILLHVSKGFLGPRVLISDFGLGKRLADDQSSFHNTIASGGGTFGWRAPECLLAAQDRSNSDENSDTPFINPKTGQVISENFRITRLIDIFSAGCVYYFTLTNGEHPFGEKLSREINIIRGNFRLQHLDSLGDLGNLGKDLVKKMIVKDTSKRIDAQKVLSHPFFWSSEKKIAFLQDISDRLEIESRDFPGSSKMLKQLERHAIKAVGQDWTRKLGRSIMDDLSKYRSYDGKSIQDLLRAFRNKKHHFHELPQAAQKEIGDTPQDFMNYWTARFPNMFLYVFNFVLQTRELNEYPAIAKYLKNNV